MTNLEIVQLAQEQIRLADISDIKRTESFEEGEYHQAILDVAYAEWQRRSSLKQYKLYVYTDKGTKVVFEGTRQECEEWADKNKEEYGVDRFSSQMIDDENNWGYSDMIGWVQDTYGDWFALMILLGKYNQQVCNGGHIQYFDNGYASIDNRGFFDDNTEIGLHVEMEEMFKNLDFNKLPYGDKVLEIMKRFRPEIDPRTSDEDREAERDWLYHSLEPLDDEYYKINDQWMNELNGYAKLVLSGR